MTIKRQRALAYASLAHLEAQLHATVVATEEAGDAADDAAAVAEERAHGIYALEKLVCIIEEAKACTVHADEARLVHEAEGAVEL